MSNYTNLEFEEKGTFPTQNGEFETTVLVAEIRTNYMAVMWRTKEVATGNITENVTIDSTSTPRLDNVHRVPPNYGASQPDEPVTSRDTGVTSN